MREYWIIQRHDDGRFLDGNGQWHDEYYAWKFTRFSQVTETLSRLDREGISAWSIKKVTNSDIKNYFHHST